jgi:hypothetical protein
MSPRKSLRMRGSDSAGFESLLTSAATLPSPHSALSPVDRVGRAAHGGDVQDLEVQLG